MFRHYHRSVLFVVLGMMAIHKKSTIPGSVSICVQPLLKLLPCEVIER